MTRKMQKEEEGRKRVGKRGRGGGRDIRMNE